MPSFPKSFLDIDSDIDNSGAQHENRPDDCLTRQSIFWRVGIFAVLQGMYLGFAASALTDPIVLHLPPNISISEIKGASTILFIVWHGIGVMIVKDILLHVFSAECLAQYERTGRLVSRKTDRVSKLTTGFFGQAHHFFRRGATVRYRLAMVLVLLFMALGGLGPSTVGVSTVSVDTPMDFELANITFLYQEIPDAGSRTVNSWLTDTRASSILRLELFEKAKFGYEASQNLMIPWPSNDFGTNGSRIVYKSDVLAFNYTCAWHKPTVWKWDFGYDDRVAVYWKVGDQIFISWIARNNGTFQVEAFTPINAWPSTFLGTSFAFFTYNRSASDPEVPFLNLTDLPTSSRSDLQSDYKDTGVPVPEAVTTLICDPQFNAYTAEVTLDKGRLNAVPINHPPINNIDSRGIVRGASAGGLLAELAYFFPDSINGVPVSSINSVARLLLFCDEDSPCSDSSLKPFPTSTINDNLNRFFRSASKVFMDGYSGTKPGVGTLSLNNFNTFTTKGVGQRDAMAMVTSPPFFVVLVVILVMITLLLGWLCVVLDPDRLLCFNLDNVSRFILSELERSPSSPYLLPTYTSSITLSNSSLSTENLNMRTRQTQ
ncbi:hypothetical protein D9756_005775 [Leucocoprinus leucothites]|uniref:Uncharacterized protein n=1 Tax=Leucocoprinus leucothites TaxID=201217 RepID=A0A8H5D8B9_9AGAR|nr:hypothetical protein D9756_005775 [Leucoagaricus leucothites]